MALDKLVPLSFSFLICQEDNRSKRIKQVISPLILRTSQHKEVPPLTALLFGVLDLSICLSHYHKPSKKGTADTEVWRDSEFLVCWASLFVLHCLACRML